MAEVLRINYIQWESHLHCIWMYFLDALDKIKVESQNGKDKFILSQVAQIKLNNGMFVVDMNGSPEVFTVNIIKLFIFLPFTEL